MATPTSTTNRHDLHATSRHATHWSTKRIAVTALFCAAAAICTLFIQFPILPGLMWLQYDPSGVVALIAAFTFGPSVGVTVSVLPYLVHLATASGFYGAIMAMVATLSLVFPASLIYKHWTDRAGAFIGMLIGATVCLAACIGANLLITPFYAGIPLEEVRALIVPALLPFNVLKIVINCIICSLVYKPVAKALAD